MKKLLILLVCCAFLAGCGAMPKKGEFVEGGTPPVLQADGESALITFLRESAFVGGGVSYYIYEDGKVIGALKSGTWFLHKASPGQHTYMAETESKSIVSLTLEAGKNYYVLGGVTMGVLAGRPELKESTEQYAKPLLKDLDYIKYVPPYARTQKE